MVIESQDRDIVNWARQRGLPCYYASEPGLDDPCLKIQCGHVTAYFNQGRLARIWAQADNGYLDALFSELTELFGIVSRSEPVQGDMRNVPSLERRLLWESPSN